MKRALSRKNLWENLPGPMKRLAGAGLSTVPLPWLLGSRFRRECAWLRESQWWPTDRVHSYQLERLRTLFTQAFERSGFYRRHFDDAGFDPAGMTDLEDLQSLPTIDKTTVLDHLEEMCLISPSQPGVDYTSTGGTSGRPLSFYIGSERSSIEYAYLASSWQRIGFHSGATMAVLRGRTVAEDSNGLRHEHDPLLRHHFYSNFHMTDDNMQRYLDHITTIGPCFLHVYPSSVTALARYIARAGITAPANIKGIIAESEIVYPEQRALVEDIFGHRLFSCYGQTEKLVLTAECEHSTDDHVWPTYGYFELLDEAGRTVRTPGETGEIVGTGFINSVVPFIRYRTGDLATYVADHCEACGRNHPLIRDIRGHRTQEVLIAGDGSEISWTALNMHDDTFDRVQQFQFYQDTPGRALLRVVPADRLEPDDYKRIRKNMNAKLEGRVSFNIETVDCIPLTERGKAIYVDQRITTASPVTGVVPASS